jgi:hypothetical protein
MQSFVPPKAPAPRIAYLFAVTAGLLGLVFGGALSIVREAPGAGHLDSDLLMILLAGFAVGQFVIGGACGLLWPRAAWRWGIWLYGVPACILSFYGRGVWFFLGWLGLTALPACAGAYAAAVLYPRFAGAGRRN